MAKSSPLIQLGHCEFKHLAMHPGTSPVLSTSIYSRLCWDCISNCRSIQAGGPAAKHNLSSTVSRLRATGNSRVHIRNFHRGRVGRQELSKISASESSSQLPVAAVLPVRQRLAKWQEENGNPMSDILGLDTAFGIRNVIADTYGASTQARSEDSKNDQDEEDLPPSLYDEDLSEYGGVYIQMGDLVEISSTRAHTPPTICVFVRKLESRHLQLITMRGKWVAVGESSISFSVPKFLDKRLVEPIVPFLPDHDVMEEVLGQTHILDPSVPRTITAPVVTALNKFYTESEEVYRKHASALDNAHDMLAHATDLRFGTLDRVTDRLVGHDSGAPRMPAMYAVRKALIRAGMGFGIDRRSHRLTGVFQIRSKEQIQYATRAVQWLREYQEWEISRKMAETSQETRSGLAKRTKGVEIIQNFVKKARAAVIESRKHRSAMYLGHGALGPSKERPSAKSGPGTIRNISTAKFDPNERVLIRVLEYYSVQGMVEASEPLRSLLPIILRATDMYSTDPYAIDLSKRAVFSFLLELGVFAPYDDITLYDVNLLLPTSQHSKPLEQLASTLELMDRNKVEMRDNFSELRKDLEGTTAFAIDDAGASEIDDAISVSRIPGTNSKAWLHIHIANPTAFISRDSIFARMAAHLTESYYSPERTVPLLPSWLTHGMLSLASGRPCLTVSALVDEQGDILDVKIEHGTLGKVIHLNYEQLPELLGLDEDVEPEMEPMIIGGVLKSRSNSHAPKTFSTAHKDDLRLIHKLARARFGRRKRNAGFNYMFTQPNVSVYASSDRACLPPAYPRRGRASRFEGDPIIAIYPRRQENPFLEVGSGSDTLVAEMMLLGGEAVSRWCDQRDIPIPYRSMQNIPGAPSYHELHASIIVPAIEKYGHITVGAGFRFLQDAGTGLMVTKAAPHYTLGLDMYTKATSPLRRYGDMIVHWQIEAALREEAKAGRSSLITTKSQNYLPFQRTQMENILLRLAPRERLISNSKQRSERHWISHFFFRAHYFNEYPLPKTMNLIILRQASSVGGRDVSFFLACWIDTGLKVKITPHDDAGNILQYGDVWEAEIDMVAPYYPETVFKPIRLLSREE